MYRIDSRNDLLSVGFYDYLEEPGENIIIIEWFGKIADFFDEHTINIDIMKPSENDENNENERRIDVYTRD